MDAQEAAAGKPAGDFRKRIADGPFVTVSEMQDAVAPRRLQPENLVVGHFDVGIVAPYEQRFVPR